MIRLDGRAYVGVAVRRIGTTGGNAIEGTGFSVAIATLKARHDAFFRDWMDS